MKCFNTTGLCKPDKHYMVDITHTLVEIREFVVAGKYFAINRARQFGKTTTLAALKRFLGKEYLVLSMDFQGLSNANFKTEELFVKSFCRMLLKRSPKEEIPEEIKIDLEEITGRTENQAALDELFMVLSAWCDKSEKPVVLMIDEVDSATNNQVFLDFLAQLRLQYLDRENDCGCKGFQSVILAGVTDIKHLKSKIRDEAKVNSPWNIAADFKIDMSFSREGIRGMLCDYEKDHHTGMDLDALSQSIFDYTDGYPYLVSRICQIVDEELVPDVVGDLKKAWTSYGIDEAVKNILSDPDSALFQSLTSKLQNYPEMKTAIRSILMEGVTLPYNADNEAIRQIEMYGFVKKSHNTVVIANRIFETRLYNLFLSEEEIKSNIFSKEGALEKNIFIEDGRLNMRLVMEHFIETYIRIFGPLKEKFKEKDARELFLLYLRPIINGTGNYYIEAQTRDQTRTDIIIDYLGRQYVIELKIWRGARYNEAGEKQLKEYLDYFGLDTGYMLSFNFNQKKETGVKRIRIGDKVLFEGMA